MRYFLYFLISVVSFYSRTQTNGRGGESENLQAGSTGKTHVVIVGISEYKNLPEGQQLDFADDDAVLLQDYLSTWGNISLKVFLNADATNKDKIGREIQMTLLNEAQAGDEVIIYFAGHGDVDTLVNDGYLLLNQVEDPSVAPYSFNDAISLTLIQRFVNLAADKRGIKVTFIADACHSGAVSNANANKLISELNTNSVTITSCQHDEVSEESIKYGNGHGIFTYYLVQGLMGMADMNSDKKVTLLELQSYVQNNVVTERDGKQTPVFTGKLSKTMAPVNEQLLSKAKKEDNLTLALASFGKDKSVTAPIGGVNGPCNALMQLLQEQSVENKFFSDELDSLDKLPFSVGASQAKKSHTKSVNAIAVSADGKFTASCSADGIVLNKGQDIKQINWLKGHSGDVSSVDFSPNHVFLVSGGLDQTAIIWNVSTGEKVKTLDKISSGVSAIKYISKDQILIGTLKGSLILWEPELNLTREYKLHKGKLNDIELNYPSVITCGDDGKINSFDLALRKKVATYEGGSGLPVRSLKVIPGSGQILSAGDDGNLIRWDLESKKMIKEIKLDLGPINDIDSDPFERYCFIASKQKKVTVLDLATGSILKTKMASTSGSNSIAYDPIFHHLKIAEPDGSVSTQEVKVLPEETAAVDVHERLTECDELKSMRYKIDGTLIIGLNNNVNKVLDALVNGAAVQPGLEEVLHAKRYAEKAFELGKDYEVDADKLEINLRLLEIYEILLTENKSAYSAAIEKVKRIEELDPRGAYAFNIAAQLYARLEDPKKAIEMAEKAEKLAPKWSQASVNTGKVLLISGDKTGAENKFKEAIKETPNESKGYTALGELYLEQGKLEEARKNLEKALQLDSGATALKAYQETMSQIELANSRGGAVNKGPVPLNTAFYRNYINVVKFSASEYTTVKISAANASLTKKGNEYTLRVSGPTKSVTIYVVSTTTGKMMGQYEIPVRDLPKVDLWWGTARAGDRMDVTADKFVYGYNPITEPDLDNSMFEIVNYIVEFQESGLRFNGTGPMIYSQLINEVKRSRKAGAKGGVCVGAVVKNKFGETFTIQSCFSF